MLSLKAGRPAGEAGAPVQAGDGKTSLGCGALFPRITAVIDLVTCFDQQIVTELMLWDF